MTGIICDFGHVVMNNLLSEIVGSSFMGLLAGTSRDALNTIQLMYVVFFFRRQNNSKGNGR